MTAGRVLSVAWYRTRATVAQRAGGLLTIVVLIALPGGIAMASIAAARRTQSSYPRFLASTNPSDLNISAFGSTGDAVTSLTSKVAALPGVRRVSTIDVPPFVPLLPDGAPNPVSATVFAIGSTDGEFGRQDHLSAVHGRDADPARADEVVVTPSAASQLHVRVGSVLPLGLFTSHTEPPRLRLNARVTGIADFNNQVIQDDVDAAYGFIVVTPAALHEAIATVAPQPVAPTTYALQLDHGARDASAVEHEFLALVPNGSQYEFHATAPVVTQDEDAIRPESIALGAFGAIAALVALVIAGQAIARQLRAGDEDGDVLRALGAGPGITIADGLVDVLLAVVIGSLAAAALALALSPLAPLGPVRAVYPARGIALDWAVVGGGLVALVVVLSAASAVIAWRHAPHRRAARRNQREAGASRVARAGANAGLPTSVTTGVRFALERDDAPGAAPVRAALLGTVVAVALVVATLTFAASLGTLVSHPALYGWNWSFALNPSNQVPPRTLALLDRDPEVQSWSGDTYIIAALDGQNVPILLARPNTPVAPPTLSGHGVAADNQIVLGATTLASLHKHIGDTVTFTYGSSTDRTTFIPPVPLKIVGTATLPAVGFASIVADHTSMGTGAIVSIGIAPPALQQQDAGTSDPNENGPSLVFVRMRAGVSAQQGRANLQPIVDATDRTLAADPNTSSENVTLMGVQRPAQIVNYRTIGAAPVVLAGGLAVGAIVALALTLSASVRRRRRDLALLKTLGFTRRQLAATVASQATVAALLGIVVGVPIGIVGGRWLWTLFAREIAAVPHPTVPAATIAAVAVATVVLANLVGAIPGRQAARTPTALLLQAE